MAAHPEVDESLRQIRLLVRQLQDDFASLPDEAWDAPSNCPPWPVRRLAAHLVENAELSGATSRLAWPARPKPR